MKRMRRIVIWLFGGLFLAATLAACGWIYATSNVATPDYAVVKTDGAVEIRDYPELVVAEITTTGSRDDAVRAGFRPLAGYIFAKEREGEKIAMTAPVTQRAQQGQDWTIQFIMPKEYTLETLPRPAGAEVRLATEPAMRRVATRFSGVADDALLAEQEAKLRAWMDANGLVADGAPLFAYYNDPFTPGFMRRNEVIFNLAE